MINAMFDPDATLHFVAMRWDAEVGKWQMVALGRTLDEIDERVEYWSGKGLEMKIFGMTEFPAKRQA